MPYNITLFLSTSCTNFLILLETALLGKRAGFNDLLQHMQHADHTEDEHMQ